MKADNQERVLFVDDQVYKLFAAKKKFTGGSAVQTLSWMNGFKELGSTVRYSSARKATDEALIYKHIKKGPKYFFWLFYLFNYYKVTKSYKPTIIYLSTAGWKTLLWSIVAKLTGAKYVQRISNNIVFEEGVYKKRLGGFNYFMSKKGVKRADLILCQNSEQKNNILKVFPKSNIEILYNPYLIDRDITKEPTKKPYVAWVGLFQYQKNLPSLVEIVQECKDIQFKIAGKSTGTFDQGTTDAVEKLKACENVEFVGFLERSQVKEFLSEATCLLNNSHYEGFSNTYLEAFANETPVITRKATDPDGIIERNNLGFVAEDYSEIPALIKKIFKEGYQNPKGLYTYVRENHDPKILAEKVTNILKEK